jgi:hypothetical protein
LGRQGLQWWRRRLRRRVLLLLLLLLLLQLLQWDKLGVALGRLKIKRRLRRPTLPLLVPWTDEEED